ncbi:phage tail protein [Ramlibacter sp. USB13]|uniref:Phage tail protein n=1 Tax=Ramlibacter cellulosilyticus TaxID=2764187 RepID=A0A923MTB5_9BURK|nr:phage tail protein [Ramlibacter cellulosilyticus]MBC5783427.1 phage tail protein [Ramlibacter cellulosilyticus]
MAATPFTSFNFAVEIVPDGASSPLVSAAFAECDGLEMGMDVKTIREGGSNDRQVRLAGPATFGQLTLKRGMTAASLQLWKWMADSVADPGLRAQAEVVLYAADGSTERARVVLERCLPVKLKVPALNAKDGGVAVEELQLAYECFTVKAGG